jgi:NAD(P)-dependent dehydrogenase (short-subunit alcohol dehydrogenase family)
MINETGLGELVALQDKVAMVTGGSGGIGSSVCELLLRAGARVVNVDLEGRPSVAGTTLLSCDFAEPSSIAGLFERFKAEFERLDILVHCAGIARDAVLWKMSDKDWSDVLRINLDSAFALLKQSIPLMRPLGQGAIVLVASINGERGNFGQSNYAASKAGVIGLGRTAAREVGKFGIRVNVISPGLIETPMTESLPEEVRRREIEESLLGTSGQPEDVARAVLFLVSTMSRHITGQVLRVNGGQLTA